MRRKIPDGSRGSNVTPAAPRAARPGRRSNVYYRESGITAWNILHEALHSLTGLDDEDLGAKLGVSVSSADTSAISEALHDHDCGGRSMVLWPVNYLRVFHVWCAILGTASAISGQGFEKCKPKIAKASRVAFRIGRYERNVEGPPTLLVQLSVPVERINSHDLVALARTLKATFCREDRVDFAIFDNYRYAERFSPVSENPYYMLGLESMRGGYYFDRTSGTDYVEFTMVPNFFKNAASRIRIDIDEKVDPGAKPK